MAEACLIDVSKAVEHLLKNGALEMIRTSDTRFEKQEMHIRSEKRLISLLISE